MKNSSIDWASWMHDANSGNPDVPIMVIAEGGINHNGDVDQACELVKMASRAGANIIKFQKREPEICVPVEVRENMRSTPWGDMTYFEYKKKTELGVDDYWKIDEVAKSEGIDWFVSAWDVPSQVIMRQFNSPVNKVASAMLTHNELLEEIASEGKPTFISTGMSTLEQIDTAVEIFTEQKCPFVLLHTVSTYPAIDSELNLRVIDTLSDRYGVAIGYSGHESSVSPSVIAAAMGAVVVERHVTLDRTLWGTDQAASLEEAGLRNLTSILSRVPSIRGNGEKIVVESEAKAAKNLRYWQ